MIENFKKAMTELYGVDFSEVFDYCINETYAMFGEPITLNELFIIWGQMCENAENY